MYHCPLLLQKIRRTQAHPLSNSFRRPVDILPRLKPWDSLDSGSIIQSYRLNYSHSFSGFMLMGFHTSCTTFSAKDLCRSLMYVLKIQNIVSSTIHFPSFLKSTDPAYPQNIQIHTHIFLCRDV